MIKLYVKDGCPFCAMVLAKVDDLGIEVEERNVSNPLVVEELIALGGKKQEPFLYDEERGTKMYEAADINDYLHENYGDGTSNKMTHEAPPGVCPV